MSEDVATPVPDTTSDLERLKFSHDLRCYHHSALWEIQKHFTWLLSIVLAAYAVILTTDVKSDDKANFLLVLALLGIAFSLLALRVVRREGEYFFNANRKFVNYHNRVFSDVLEPPTRANLSLVVLLARALTPWKLGVRDAFQLVSVVFALVFLVLLVLLRP